MANNDTTISTPVNSSVPVRPQRAANVAQTQGLPEAKQPTQEATEVSKAVQHRNEVDTVVKKLNEYMQNERRGLQFHVDDSVDRVVVKVVDLHTNEVVRQFPSDEVIALARQLADQTDPKLFGSGV